MNFPPSGCVCVYRPNLMLCSCSCSFKKLACIQFFQLSHATVYICVWINVSFFTFLLMHTSYTADKNKISDYLTDVCGSSLNQLFAFSYGAKTRFYETFFNSERTFSLYCPVSLSLSISIVHYFYDCTLQKIKVFFDIFVHSLFWDHMFFWRAKKNVHCIFSAWLPQSQVTPSERERKKREQQKTTKMGWKQLSLNYHHANDDETTTRKVSLSSFYPDLRSSLK